ncbi:cytoplasmic protein [Coprinopsis cinerea AmutBmut pab1-1]|nr:cytoplasmic protein [Coprinopsis cinerea AmutBmut pab1-1]
MWEPLPLIVYGYAVHPLSPSRRETRISTRNRLSTVTEVSVDDQQNRDVVNLEVGDEVYAFERYIPPNGRETDVWYRGYVVCPTKRPPVTWASDPSSVKPPVKTEEPQQVFIGIFPASHIYIRDELSDAEGRLPELARTLNGSTGSSQGGNYGRVSPAETYFYWNKEKGSMGMDTLREEDEEDYYAAARKSFRLGPPPEQANSSRAGLPVYSASIRSASPAGSQIAKPLPPRPSLKSGDDTASGTVQPIIDEIASALREWHNLMFQYLARRDYQLFHIVKDQIEALHLGRRQLLANTLSAEETVSMRQECVTKLVVGNLIQGLDVIVRHPTWGALVTVDVEGEPDQNSWVSAIRMYTMQTALAYLDVAKEDPKLGVLRASFDHSNHNLTPTPAHSVFAEAAQVHRKTRSRSLRLTGITAVETSKAAPAQFYHLFFELRAFVASLCSPGETVELFFSLYAKASSQFLTEDFCVVLNHNGVLARDPASRIRTLFTDLSFSEVRPPVYLVCRIVRNGSLKIGHDISSGVPYARRGSEGHVRGDSSASPIVGSPLWTPDVGSPSSYSPRSPGATDGQFRRPFGCAVLELTELAKMVHDQADASALREYTMPIFVPTNEISFSTLHQHIINGNTKEFERSSRADSVAISVKSFRGNLQAIVRENTSTLQGIPRTLQLGFPDAVFPGETRNELYIKLWSGEFSSSSSSSGRLSVSSFGRQLGSVGNTMEITIELRDNDGTTIPNSIARGSGEEPMTYFHSMVFQRFNEPTFGELIKLQLPSNGVPQWHLFFTIRNRGRTSSKGSPDNGDKPYAFAFQPLFPESDTFLEDDSHVLILYRADKLPQISAATYLSAPSRLENGQKIEHLAIPADMSRFTPPMRDTITIRSSLCSTKFTHKPVLSRLLNWEKQEQEVLAGILTEFTFIGEREIVKYLADIFNSLFGILVSSVNQSGELDLLVFNALVTVLSIVQDRRFKNFQPVLDVYIEKHFNFALAASHIIHSMNRLLANPASPESATHLRAALKVWHYIFKFIARSRELQKAKELGMGGGATAEHLESKFKRELKSHLAEVTRMMSTSSPPSIIGTQTIALQHFTSILPELAKIFNTVELVSIATTFANSVTAVKGKIVIWKLIMYLQIVKSFLFDNPTSRPLLAAAVVSWIQPHFGRYDEYAHTHISDSEATKDAARVSWLESIRLCVTIIAVMLDKLDQQLVNPAVKNDLNAIRQEQENIEYLIPLIPRLLDSYREIQSPASKHVLDRVQSPSTAKAAIPVTFPESYPFSLLSSWPKERQTGPTIKEDDGTFYPSLGETAIVFLTLVLSAPTAHILSFFESSFDIEGRERFVNLVSTFFKVATSILDNEAFPKTWLNVNVLAHKVLVKMMDPVATMLVREFVPSQDSEIEFDVTLWKDGFFMLLKLLSSEHLVIEEFSPQVGAVFI